MAITSSEIEKAALRHIEYWLQKREKDKRVWGPPGVLAHLIAEGFVELLQSVRAKAYAAGHMSGIQDPCADGDELQGRIRQYEDEN